MRIAYASLAAFQAKASQLAGLLNLKHRQGFELLAKVSGYANYHEAGKSDLAIGIIPLPKHVANRLREELPTLDTARAERIAEVLALHKIRSRPNGAAAPDAGDAASVDALPAEAGPKKVVKGTRATRVDYFAAFDCLNNREPLLVGFVRQPASHGACFKALEERWSWRLMRQRLNTGALLAQAGFNAGWLSVFYRRASAEEIVAYEQVSKDVGATLKCLIREADGRWHPVRSRHAYIPHEPVPARDILEQARLTGPVTPKLVARSRWDGRGQTLFNVIDQLPENQRALARERVLDAGMISMKQFVVEAERVAPQPLVLAADFDRWRFCSHIDGWSARLAAEEWSVTLSESDAVLTVELQVAANIHIQQLAPYTPQYSYGLPTPYSGNLSSLLHFMRRLEWLPNSVPPEFLKETGRSPLDWVLEAADWALHGDLRDLDVGDGTDWPHIDSNALRST